MNRYKDLHKWMLIPMLFMQLGIFMDYWGDFTDNAWAVHVHYWTGTVWYIYLIIQPYFATHGKLDTHRTNGIIGIFLAGGVCLTALSMMHRDIMTTQRALEIPDQFGPFQPWFFFGVAAVEIVMMTAFGYAVIKSIVHRKSMEDHAWWLISTVFLIMMPALGRGIQIVYVGMYREDWPAIDIMMPIPSFDYWHADLCGLEIRATETPGHLHCYWRKPVYLFTGTDREITRSADVLESDD